MGVAVLVFHSERSYARWFRWVDYRFLSRIEVGSAVGQVWGVGASKTIEMIGSVSGRSLENWEDAGQGGKLPGGLGVLEGGRRLE